MRAKILAILGTIMVLVTLVLDLLVIPGLATPQEKNLIEFSPIFYWHIPVAWIALFAFLIVFIASIAYLVKRKPFWDIVATTSAELGLVFTTLFLLTGSIWARYAWGHWWLWEARLTTSLILWVIYVAYFLIRAYIPVPEQRARFGAVVGILGFLDVPVVISTLFISNQIHPSGFTMTSPWEVIGLVSGVIAFTLLYFALLFFVTHIREDQSEVLQIKQLLEEKENE
jgi:heme exporter protein C